jgi:hypothetical protein
MVPGQGSGSYLPKSDSAVEDGFGELLEQRVLRDRSGDSLDGWPLADSLGLTALSSPAVAKEQRIVAFAGWLAKQAFGICRLES